MQRGDTPSRGDNVRGRIPEPDSHPEWTLVAEHGGMLRCNTCHQVHEPSKVHVERMERWDMQSDPEDQSVVATLRCPTCGAIGDIELPFGPSARDEEARVLSQLDWQPH